MTQAEKRAALAQSQAMTGFVAEATEERLFLKCAFSSDDISTVWLDPILAAELFWALKRLLKNPQEFDGAAAKLPAGAKPEYGGWRWAPEN